jgi:hypothetical protein
VDTFLPALGAGPLCRKFLKRTNNSWRLSLSGTGHNRRFDIVIQELIVNQGL